MILLVRIMVRNKEHTDAYAEEIKSYRVIKGTDDKIMYVDANNSCHFGRLSDIIRNPEIINVCVRGHYYKIKLPEGL